MSMHLERINNQNIRPIQVPGFGLPVKGADCLSDPYGTAILIAKRKSGKTNVIFHLIKNCINKDTIVLIFCSSAHNDDNWKAIRKYLKKQGNEFEVFTSIYENGVNEIDELLKQLQDNERAKEEAEENEGEEENTTQKVIDYLDKWKKKDKDDEEEKKKKRKPKYLAPEYLIIFDDISAELRSAPVIKLFKEARHYKIKVLASTQYLYDLDKSARSQVGNWLLFKAQPEEKIKAIYEIAEVHEPFETFYNAYKIATTPTKKCQYPFFNYDSTTQIYKRCFNQIIHV